MLFRLKDFCLWFIFILKNLKKINHETMPYFFCADFPPENVYVTYVWDWLQRYNGTQWQYLNEVQVQEAHLRSGIVLKTSPVLGGIWTAAAPRWQTAHVGAKCSNSRQTWLWKLLLSTLPGLYRLWRLLLTVVWNVYLIWNAVKVYPSGVWSVAEGLKVSQHRLFNFRSWFSNVLKTHWGSR